jgi:hypothetical protein
LNVPSHQSRCFQEPGKCLQDSFCPTDPAFLCQGCQKKHCHLWGLNNRFIFSWVWRLEVQGQGMGRIGFLFGLSLL